MEAQGCNVTDNVIEQDNRASISLENNGKASSSKRTKPVNIRFFFVTDRISKGEVRVEWCPTLEMIGDFMTKPAGSTIQETAGPDHGSSPSRESQHCQDKRN